MEIWPTVGRFEGQHRAAAASGAFGEFLQHQFRDWDLPPSESDVALFAIKGSSIAEIAARMRGTKDGTIKAQLNAIYRKAGVTGHPQLISSLSTKWWTGSRPQPGGTRGRHSVRLCRLSRR